MPASARPAVRFGIMTLQGIPYPEMVERWRRLDALGFDSAWVGDHFVDPFAPAGPWFDDYAAAAGRDPRSIVRSLLCGFTPDRPFASLEALRDFVGRYRQIGIDEFIFHWLTEDGHPVFPERGLRGAAITDAAMLERITVDALPALRSVANG